MMEGHLTLSVLLLSLAEKSQRELILLVMVDIQYIVLDATCHDVKS